MENRLVRSRTDAMIGGVCGGLARYLAIDSTLVRLFFLLMAVAGGGTGFWIYMLMWILIPLEGSERGATFEQTLRNGSEEIAGRAREMGDDLRSFVRSPNPQASRIIGIALVVLGLIFLIQNLRLPWLAWLDSDVIWPILLILAGIALLRRFFQDR